MKLILTALMAIILMACQKEETISQPKQSCAKVILLSYKYTSDTLLLRTDTLWFDNNLCGKDLDTIKTQKDSWIDWTHCPPPVPSWPEFRLEKRHYVIK